MNRYKRLAGIGLAIFLFCQLGASTSGEYGFQMLKIPLSPGVAAMGGTGAYFSGDALTFLENPVAGLDYKGRVITFSHNNWLIDYQLQSLAYRTSNRKNSFGVAYRTLDYGKHDRRDEIGTEILGEFHPLDLSIAVNYAFRINPNHSVGINLVGLYEKIDTASSIGLSTDIGYLYKTMLKDFHILAAVKNLGTTSKMNKEAMSLPLTSELSFLKQFSLKETTFSTEAKLLYHLDDDNMKAAFGGKVNLYRIFNLRAGYQINHDMYNLTAGFGIHYQKFMIDYSYLPTKEDINPVHIFALSYLF